AAETLQPRSSALSDALNCYLDRRTCCRYPGGHSRYRHAFRFIEHRDTVRVRAGITGSDYSSIPRSRAAPWFSCSRRNCRARLECYFLRAAHGRTTDPYMAAVLRLAADRVGSLPLLQPQA